MRPQCSLRPKAKSRVEAEIGAPGASPSIYFPWVPCPAFLPRLPLPTCTSSCPQCLSWSSLTFLSPLLLLLQSHSPGLHAPMFPVFLGPTTPSNAPSSWTCRQLRVGLAFLTRKSTKPTQHRLLVTEEKRLTIQCGQGPGSRLGARSTWGFLALLLTSCVTA